MRKRREGEGGRREGGREERGREGGRGRNRGGGRWVGDGNGATQAQVAVRWGAGRMLAS